MAADRRQHGRSRTRRADPRRRQGHPAELPPPEGAPRGRRPADARLHARGGRGARREALPRGGRVRRRGRCRSASRAAPSSCSRPSSAAPATRCAVPRPARGPSTATCSCSTATRRCCARETLARMAEHKRAHRRRPRAALRPGRRAGDRRARRRRARSRRIVEVTDATPDELAIRERNTGVYLLDAGLLWKLLERVDDRNAQGELYLTDDRRARGRRRPARRGAARSPTPTRRSA